MLWRNHLAQIARAQTEERFASSSGTTIAIDASFFSTLTFAMASLCMFDHCPLPILLFA
jgi:hypothetical protein